MEDAYEIQELCEKHDITCRINFPRRLDKRLNLVAKVLPSSPKKVVAFYTSSFENFSPHLFDFFLQNFGKIETITTMSVQRDPRGDCYDFQLLSEKQVPIFVHGLGFLKFQQLDCEIFYDDQRITLLNGMAECIIRTSKTNLIYNGFNHLAESEYFKPQAIGGLVELYDTIKQNIGNPEAVGGCTIHEAIIGERIKRAVVKSHSSGNVPVRLSEV